MDDKVIRFRKPPPIRCLRSYTRWADRSYHCYEDCSEGILPGQPYHANVMVQGKRLWVERRHSRCCPPDPMKEEMEEKAREARRAA
jgi:hypothetical protein